MAGSGLAGLVLENRHTGERLVLRRRRRGEETWLEIEGSLRPGGQGPPLHTHVLEDEEGEVRSGTLAAIIGGREVVVRPGERAILPRGVPHRWWNGGDTVLEFLGYARPVVDLDRYLQALFDLANASPDGRPSGFHLAHVLWRHRRTQRLNLPLPWPLQHLVLALVVGVGTVLGRYRGTGWPGCPSRCPGAPGAADSAV